MDRVILEKALVALLNGHNEKAEEIFHNFVVSKARSIYESYRNEDFNEEELSETYFTEDDLSSLEDEEHEEASDELADDLGTEEVTDEEPVADESEEVEGEDLEGSEDLEGEEVEGEVEDRLEDIEDQLAKLTTEFERIMAEMSDEEGSSEFGDENAVDGEELPTDDMSDEEPKLESFMTEEDDEEEYDSLEESLMNELEKVKFVNSDGLGSNGAHIEQNKKSVVLQKPVNARDGAKPVSVKSKNKTDFKPEPALASHTEAKLKNERKQPAKIAPVSGGHIGEPAEPSKFVPVKKK